MALDKIGSRNIFQRFRNLILGTERPNLLTRISVLIGFLIWIYLFSWHLITFLSLSLMENLSQSPRIRAAYGYIGHKYHYTDTINRLTLYSAIEIILYLVIVLSLALIWRRKKTGLIMYVIGNLLTLFVTFFIMGVRFMQHEIPLFDYILILSTILYFTLGIFIFYRRPKEQL